MIDKHHPIPVYYQLQQEIRQRIEAGEWKPGDLLPSERELSEKYGISRMTVRQSLSSLVLEGFLRREKGRGTFVAHPRIQQTITRLTGFTQDMRARGFQPGSKVLQVEVCESTTEVAEYLQIRLGDPVVLLKRLRMASNAPIEVQSSYLPDNRFHDLIHENLENNSLYDLLQKKFFCKPSRATERWEAVACPLAEAQLLTIRKGDPVFHAYRTTYDFAGEPFEYVHSYIRGDLYYLYVEPHLDS